jgi:hypothetical protein
VARLCICDRFKIRFIAFGARLNLQRRCAVCIPLEGENGMIYAVRKRSGQWVVYSEDNVVLHFESYDEAVEVARSAAEVLSRRHLQDAVLPSTPSG